jgi:Tfp pilus assembly protein PilN
MRELEFLPDWYPSLQRRKRLVRLEIWLIVAVSVAVGIWMVAIRHAVEDAGQAQARTESQLVLTETQLRKIDKLTELEAVLKKQEQIQTRLGVYVETARLLGTIASIMPVNMSLLSIQADAKEVVQPMSALTRAALKDPTRPPADRRLFVKLGGVAPTDVDLATFVTELNKVPFFEDVAPSSFKERRKDGHVMREFELTFTVNLNMPAGS